MREKRSLWLELTPSCNVSCAFCYNPWRAGGKTAYPSIAPYEVLAEGIERLARNVRFDYVALSGGEPMLYPHLLELTRWLTDRGQRTILTTNGRLLSPDRLSSLKDAGLQGVQVSLLGSRRRTHDELAGRQCWTQAVRALVGTRESGLSSSATFIATAKNIAELTGVVELLSLLGVPCLIVNELQLVGSATHNQGDLEMSVELFESALDGALPVAERLGVQILPIRAASAGDDRDFTAGWRRWSVSPDCQLKLCNHSTRTLGPVGDLSDDRIRALARGLRGDGYEDLRDLVNNCLCFERALERRNAAVA